MVRGHWYVGWFVCAVHPHHTTPRLPGWILWAFLLLHLFVYFALFVVCFLCRRLTCASCCGVVQTAQIVLNAGVLDTLPRLVQSISGSKRASRRPPPSGDRVNNDLYVGASTGINDMGRLVLPGNGGFSTPMVSSSRSRGVETACGACELISALIQSGSGHSVGSGDDSIFEQLLHSSVLEAMIPGIIGGHAHLRGAAQAVLCQSLLACSSAQQLRCLASKGAVPAISGALRYVQSVQDLTNLLRVVYHMLQLERLDSSTTPSSEERGAADTVLLYGEPESKLPCSSMSPLARRPQAGKRPLYDQFTAMGLEDQLQSILTVSSVAEFARAREKVHMCGFV